MSMRRTRRVAGLSSRRGAGGGDGRSGEVRVSRPSGARAAERATTRTMAGLLLGLGAVTLAAR
ncbi:MAG TPA: hypothetical protein VFB84_14205 [Micromonosporaceae bacterium]|nr:hypothetical protein [Micromonosporaceae bacterium]